MHMTKIVPSDDDVICDEWLLLPNFMVAAEPLSDKAEKFEATGVSCLQVIEVYD